MIMILSAVTVLINMSFSICAQRALEEEERQRQEGLRTLADRHRWKPW